MALSRLKAVLICAVALTFIAGSVLVLAIAIQRDRKTSLWKVRDTQMAEYRARIIPKVEHNLPGIWKKLDTREIYLGHSIDMVLAAETPVSIQRLGELELYIFAQEPSWAHGGMEIVTVLAHDGEVVGAHMSSDFMYCEFFMDWEKLERYGKRP